MRSQSPINQTSGLGAGRCVAFSYLTVRKDISQERAKVVSECKGYVVLHQCIGKLDLCSSSLKIREDAGAISITKY